MTNRDVRDVEEVEWQFDVDDLVDVEAWLRERSRAGDVQLHFLTPETHRDIYFDSADWRIFRAGYVLRARTDAEGTRCEATLKSFGTQGALDKSLKVRREITERLDVPEGTQTLARALARAPGTVGQHVRNVLGKHRLRSLFELTTNRHSVLVRRESVPIAEIALDDVRSEVDAPRSSVALKRVEIEAALALTPEASAVLHTFVENMQEACVLHPASLSKFEAGLIAQDLDPRPANVPQQVGDDPTIGDLVFAMLRENFAQFTARESGARMGEDIEHVHRMRVAIRKLRAAMSLFRNYLPADNEPLRAELGWVASVLGAVRDLDVQLARVQFWHSDDAVGKAGGIDAVALRNLEELLQAMRAPAQTRLLRALNSKRYSALLANYEAMLRTGPSGDLAKRPARSVLPALILKRYVKVREMGDAIDDASHADALHALRIECKRLRYALEFATPLYAKAIRNFLPRLVELQDLLGEHQDAYVAIEQMQALAQTHKRELPAQTMQAFDDIERRYAASAQQLRSRFARPYQRLKGKAWLGVQRALDHS